MSLPTDSKEHEYCMVYAKNIALTQEMFIDHDKEYLKRYKEDDDDGKYFWDTFARPGLKNPIHYDIVAPDGTIMNYGWIHSKERFEKEVRENKVRIIPKAGGGWSVQFKQYLNEKGKKPRSMTMDFGGNQEGKIDLKNLFDTDKFFSYPKSVKFIKTLISTLEDKDLIVLDFFSGSATTAHAVMQLNAEDGGHRKFIMVQLPELTDEKSEAFKAGYKNICEKSVRNVSVAQETKSNLIIPSPQLSLMLVSTSSNSTLPTCKIFITHQNSSLKKNYLKQISKMIALILTYFLAAFSIGACHSQCLIPLKKSLAAQSTTTTTET